MGWKLAAIFVRPVEPLPSAELLDRLGFERRNPLGLAPLSEVIHPKRGTIHVGRHRDGWIVTSWELAEGCLSRELSPIERKLMEIFPGSEIGAVALHSVVNLWGLSLAANGEKKRVGCGSSDSGVILNFGTPLAEENQGVPPEGSQEDEFPDFDWEDLIFGFTQRFYGERIDSTELAVSMEGWQLAAHGAGSVPPGRRLATKIRFRRREWLIFLVLLVLAGWVWRLKG